MLAKSAASDNHQSARPPRLILIDAPFSSRLSRYSESTENLSRELGVPSYRLERWRERALSGIDGSLREREGDAVSEELAAAMKRIGEPTMENEVLRARVGHVGPLARRRSR